MHLVSYALLKMIRTNKSSSAPKKLTEEAPKFYLNVPFVSISEISGNTNNVLNSFFS